MAAQRAAEILQHESYGVSVVNARFGSLKAIAADDGAENNRVGCLTAYKVRGKHLFEKAADAAVELPADPA